MVLLYSSIVFFILLTVSVVTITSVHYIMNDSLRDELKSRAAAAIQYLDDYGKVDTTIFVRANVPPSMNLQIMTAQAISSSTTARPMPSAN